METNDQLTGVGPDVSLLIPVHNRVGLTQACIDSLFAHADPEISTEIIVIDDCSTDGTEDYLSSLGDRVRVLRNASRGCFGHNMNKAALQAYGDYLLLLNNDTEVTPFWLRRMLDAARADTSIGVVGNRHLYPDGWTINHAGIAFDARCRPVHLYPGQAADFWAANVSREFQALTGACCLVRRSVFLELEGFDPNFHNGWEDIDLCLRLRERGYKVWYAADSVIYHRISATAGRFERETQNETYFTQKWLDKIVPDLEQYLIRDGQLPPVSASRIVTGAPAASKGSADLHLAVPLRHGNAFTWVTAQLALACEDAGLKVSIPAGPIDPSIEPAVRSRLQRMTGRTPSARAQVKWSHFWAPHWEQEINGRINAEFFCTNYRYGTQPLHALDQWMRHTVLNANRKLPASKYCLEALTELGVSEARCRVLPYGYSPEILRDAGADERYRSYGFVFLALTNGHDPYRYGTDILLQAFTRAFPERNDVVLVLKDYGGRATGPLRSWLRQLLSAPRVIHHSEFLPKEALIRLYRGADAMVAPFRGEGFGMKVLDACAAGLPLLAPHYGGPADYLRTDEFSPLRFSHVPVGECLDRREAIVPTFAHWIEVDVDDLAVKMREAVEHAAAARQRAVRACGRVLEEFSWSRAATTLTTAIEEFEHERDTTISARRQASASPTTLSVIMPTYNRPEQLARTLQAYRHQTLPTAQWEIVLSDDCSNYDVRRHVAPFVEQLNLRFVANDTNSGPGPARNRAIPHIRGELVLFTGDDIVPARDFLANHLACHRQHNNPQLAVLGHTDWDPDLQVTRLMRYVTGEGGQQFAYQALRPDSFVSYGYFYTSNVSVPFNLLQRQEELFSDKFPKYALEDVELGLRLAQDGMQLLYAPEAVATHLHAMSDDEIFSRQYAVGRSMVTYAMLHPQRLDQNRRAALRWLETFQHVLAFQPAFVAVERELARAAAATDAWLAGMLQTATALENVGPTLALQPAWAARLVGEEVARHSGGFERLCARRLQLAELDGLADEWCGLPRGAPNPARDFLRVSVIENDFLKSAMADEANASQLFRLARLARRHWLLRDICDRCLRVPGAIPLVERGVRLLRRLP
jgi:GT2 family glycosyltransferase/glycosyltransferase involved in cell wall biosynthesis